MSKEQLKALSDDALKGKIKGLLISTSDYKGAYLLFNLLYERQCRIFKKIGGKIDVGVKKPR